MDNEGSKERIATAIEDPIVSSIEIRLLIATSFCCDKIPESRAGARSYNPFCMVRTKNKALPSLAAHHNRNLLIGQAVELIDNLINKRIGLLKAGEQGIEFDEAGIEFALQRFLKISA